MGGDWTKVGGGKGAVEEAFVQKLVELYRGTYSSKSKQVAAQDKHRKYLHLEGWVNLRTLTFPIECLARHCRRFVWT